MAAAAQLHGSAATAATYRRTRAYSVPSSCRVLWSPLVGYPKLLMSTNGVGLKPFSFAAKISTNENAQVEELNLRSDQMKEFVQAEGHPQKRSAKIHDFCLGIPFGGLLFSMGLLGYMFSRSTISIVLGVAPGLATLLLGTLSLKFWRSGKSSVLFILAQAGGMSFNFCFPGMEVFSRLLLDKQTPSLGLLCFPEHRNGLFLRVCAACWRKSPTKEVGGHPTTVKREIRFGLGSAWFDQVHHAVAAVWRNFDYQIVYSPTWGSLLAGPMVV